MATIKRERIVLLEEVVAAARDANKMLLGTDSLWATNTSVRLAVAIRTLDHHDKVDLNTRRQLGVMTTRKS